MRYGLTLIMRCADVNYFLTLTSKAHFGAQQIWSWGSSARPLIIKSILTRSALCSLVELVAHAPEQFRIRIFCDDLVELRLQIGGQTDIIKQNILHAPH